MKKLKNMVAVIVCLSVMLTVPAHAQLTSTEHGWLESIKNSTIDLETYVSDIRAMFSSTQLARNPIAYYTNAVYTQLQNFQSLFQVNGRVDNYFWDWTTLFSGIHDALYDSAGYSFIEYSVAMLDELTAMKTGISSTNLNLQTFRTYFRNAFDPAMNNGTLTVYQMLSKAYDDLILPAETLDKTIYELLYDMHTELGGYEEGNYGYTLYGTLNEQLNLLKLREPIWEYELEEFNKNKFTYEFIGDNFTSGTDSETSLGMDSIMSMYELLHDVNTDLQDAGRQSDFLDEMNRVDNDGSGWFSSDTQNALDSVPQVMLFSDDTDPYNMNDYNMQWEVLSDVVH